MTQQPRERAVVCSDCTVDTWTWNTNGRCDEHQTDTDEQEQRPT